jgi:hypothetical protein
MSGSFPPLLPTGSLIQPHSWEEKETLYSARVHVQMYKGTTKIVRRF